MIHFVPKRQAGIIAIALICSFSSSLSFAAPAPPVIRAPGNSSGSTFRKPAVTKPGISSGATAPAPAAASGVQAAAGAKPLPVTAKPAPVPQKAAAGTPAPGTIAAACKTTGSSASAAAAKSVPPQTRPQHIAAPGHHFSIQNSPENYRSLLSESATSKLDAALAGMIGGTGEKVPGLAVIVFKDGREVYRNMMGNRFLSPRNKNWNLPVTADSLFRVASISKIFTAAGYLQLVEQGKIGLDEDVSRYLGFTLRNPKYPGTPITSRMLLSHTSSVRDYPTPYVPFSSSVQSFFRSGNCWSSASVPGTYFSYSNLNFILLATILEKVSGLRFDNYISKNILMPLDSKGSFNLRDFSSADLEKLGTLYRKTNGEAGRYYAQIDDRPPELPSTYRLANYRPGTNAGIFSPQGGLRITPEGLSHMLQMLMDQGYYRGRQILQPSTVHLMEQQVWKYNPARRNGNIENDSIESYGLALQHFSGTGSTRPAPDRPDFDLVGHLGEAYGFIGGMMWQPGTRNGFIFLQNGFATSYGQNKGRYSRNYRWEENFMKAIIENVFPKQ